MTLTDFLAGFVKSFVFAILIAGIGCLRGLQTAAGASAVGVGVDAAGNAYLAGNSDVTDLPTTPGVLVPSGAGAFAAKVNTAGSSLAYLTYLGQGAETLPPLFSPHTRAADNDSSLLDVVDSLLNKGVVVNGDLVLGVAKVDLIYAKLSVLLAALDRVMGEPSSKPKTRTKRRR